MHNEIVTIFGITIYGYGLMIGLGFIMAVVLSCWRAKRVGLSSDAVIDLALIALIVGFLGAKILYIIVEFERFLADPISVLGSGGFVVYGGIVTGVLGAICYCRIKKLSFLEYFDLMMPGVAVAQGMGRIGCFLAGCCYGRPTDSWIGVVFPEGSIAPAGIKLLPTQLFSAAGDFLLALVLILISRRKPKKGNIGALYLILYGTGRYVIELFRNDPRGDVGALSTSQFISIFIVIFGVVLYFVNKRRPDEPATASGADDEADKEAAEEAAEVSVEEDGNANESGTDVSEEQSSSEE